MFQKNSKTQFSLAFRLFISFTILLSAYLLATDLAFAKKTNFDHDKTGYILSGSHQRVTCETCHLRGIFKGTPKQCQDCHSRISLIGATKKHANHIQSSDSCDDCHTEISFNNAAVDHSNVTGSCFECHNSTTATGKPSNHVKSSDSCDNCHSTRAWTPARFDHNNITQACSSCHNGIIATGKNANHIASSDTCNDCHLSFTTWEGANVHRGITDNCNRCHNGSVAGAKTKAQAVPTHIISSTVCEDCHSNTKFDSFKGANVHIGVTDNCNRCHNGSVIGATTKAQAVPTHIVSSTVCEDCHSNTKFDSFKGANVHQGVIDNCNRCHNGTVAGATTKAQAVPPHITSSNVCEDCHAGFSTFKGANVHVGVSDNCFRCHNGSVIGAKTKAQATPTHIPSSNVCEDCHSNTKFDSFTGANPHQNVTGNCFSCHNGTIPNALSKAQAVPPHIPSSTVCEDCHTGFATFKGANPHKNVTGNCFSCHNGTIPTALSKAQAVPTHIISSNVCEDCHKSFITFQGADVHSGVVDNCVRCHNGTVPGATSKAQAVPPHISSSDICEDCHKSFTSFKGANPHVGVTGNCFSCHNGTSATAIGKNAAPTLHVPSSNTCEDCHTGFTTFKGAKYDHAGVTTCAKCHLTQAPLGGGHSTSTQCEICHTFSPKSWTVIIFKHADVASPGNCLECHRNDKNGGHFSTTLVCDACHSSAGRWRDKVRYDHNSANYPGDHGANISRCQQCHTGNSALISWPNLATYKPDCAGCHAGDYKASQHPKNTGGGNYSVSELRDCSGACHLKGKSAKSNEHRPTGEF